MMRIKSPGAKAPPNAPPAITLLLTAIDVPPAAASNVKKVYEFTILFAVEAV